MIEAREALGQNLLEAQSALASQMLGFYKTRRGDVVHVVYIIPEEDAKVVSEFCYTEHRISYRVVGYFISNLNADTWKYPSGCWAMEDHKNSRDLTSYLGQTGYTAPIGESDAG